MTSRPRGPGSSGGPPGSADHGAPPGRPVRGGPPTGGGGLLRGEGHDARRTAAATPSAGGVAHPVSEAQLTSGLVELSVYGIVSLYEKYDPAKDATAAKERRGEDGRRQGDRTPRRTRRRTKDQGPEDEHRTRTDAQGEEGRDAPDRGQGARRTRIRRSDGRNDPDTNARAPRAFVDNTQDGAFRDQREDRHARLPGRGA